MFISFSKMITKVGGFRLGLGLRITKNNIIWMSFIIMFVCILQLCWYMMIMMFWMVYAIVYGMIYSVKKILTIKKQKQQ
jgi:hypothetical protein